MATGRRLLQFHSLFAQQALRAATRPKPQPNPYRLLHSPSHPAAASRSPSSNLLLWRNSGSLLSMSAAAVGVAARAAASRWLAARGVGSLDLFSLQRRRAYGWLASSSAFLHGVHWARWMPSAENTVLMLMGANVAVFMLWRLADRSFMGRHFMVSLDSFKSGRLHTLLTCAFSHVDSIHLMINMIGIHFFGRAISNMFGPAFLLKLYLAGALTGSAFFLLEKAFLSPRKQVYVGGDSSRAPALGADAAVYAIVFLDIFLRPKKLIYLYFVIPIPAAIVGALFIGTDLWRVNEGKGSVSGSSHLGGVLVAALMWARIRKGLI